jgi:type II secretory pathway component GspD/PulD (secretin)
VIGGLRRRTVTQTVKKVPIIGDMPLMGTLFSDVTEEVKTNELIIFITPKIVIEPTLSPREIENFKATNFSDPRKIDVGDERSEEVEEEPISSLAK